MEIIYVLGIMFAIGFSLVVISSQLNEIIELLK